MLTIKLAKIGKKNKKVFRLVVLEKSKDPYGRALEILGSYNPYNKELKVKNDRVKHWISQGSQMTKSVNNLLVEQKVIEAKKVKNSRPGTPNKLKQAKIEKTKEKEVQAAQEKQATEDPKENPTEEVKSEEKIEKAE